MKLGLLTAPFPDTPLDEVVDWTAANGFESHRDRVLAADDRADPALRRHVPHRRREPVGRPGHATSAAEIAGQGLHISGLGFYPNPLHPDADHRDAVIGHLKHVITAAEKMDVPLRQHVHGRRRGADQDQNWERALEIWPDIVRSPTTTGAGSRSRTARCSSATTSGRAGTTSPASPHIWRRILEQWGGTIGLNFDPSHLILQMIDSPRFIKEFGPHILHVQAKDLTIDRDGLYERGMLSMGIGWQVPRLPGLGDVDWARFHARPLPGRLRRRRHHRARGPRLRGHRRARQARASSSPATSCGRTSSEWHDPVHRRP